MNWASKNKAPHIIKWTKNARNFLGKTHLWQPTFKVIGQFKKIPANPLEYHQFSLIKMAIDLGFHLLETQPHLHFSLTW